eukprot:jgi/Mesvir1/17376/Mv08680-RA.1
MVDPITCNNASSDRSHNTFVSLHKGPENDSHVFFRASCCKHNVHENGLFKLACRFHLAFTMVVYRRYVEIGRVCLINFGENYGKLVAIVDVVDQTRALVDAPDMQRGPISFRRLSLTDLKVDIKRIPKKADLVKAWAAADVAGKWSASRWGRKMTLMKTRAAMTDLDRYKLMVAQKKRGVLVRKELKKLVKTIKK